MPGLDGTGPEGQGSQTGRGMGRCGNNTPADTNNQNIGWFGRMMGRRGAGRGTGRGMGRGMGRRGRY